MATLWRDLRGALRLFVHSPAFVASVILPLTIALGANTALFSVVRGVLLRPLPYPEPDRLVRVYRGDPKNLSSLQGPLSPLDYRDDMLGLHAFRGVAAWVTGSASLASDGPAEHVSVGMATASFLPVLGLATGVGRWFAVEEEQQGRNHRLVLSHALWARRFGSDPLALGRTLQIDGEPYEIVGVLPAGIELPERCDIWIPLSFQRSSLEPPARNRHFLGVVGRLGPGVSLDQARQELVMAANRTLLDHQDAYPPGSDFIYAPVPLHEDVVRAVRPTVALLFGAVALVLLMACANVGNLLLARATGRGRELAIRSALGASRREIVRQLLVESLVLSIAAGLLGALLAGWSVSLLLALAPSGLPRANAVEVDGLVLGFALALSSLTGVLFGILPALTASQVGLDEALRGGSASTKPRPRRLRRALVVVDVALALVLLTGASLLLRSFVNAVGVDPGFRSQGVLTFRVAVPVPSNATEEQTADRLGGFFDRALQRLREIPGVQSVGAVDVLPLSMNRTDRIFEVDGAPTAPGAPRPDEEARLVAPGFFESIRVPLVRGRLVETSDRSTSPGIVVVNQAFEKKWFRDGGALGRRIRLVSPAHPWATVAGVVGDVREFGLDAPVKPIMYFPIAQVPSSEMTFVLRAADSLTETSRAATAALSGLDAQVPVFGMQPFDALLSSSVSQRRFLLVLVGAFASIALLLAALGLYGVVAYSVRQRTREIGVRMALGADAARIVRMVAGESGWMLGVGLAAGLAGALGTARLLGSFLYGVGPADPWALGAAGGVLAVAAAIATGVPVRRATRVDAVVALGAE